MVGFAIIKQGKGVVFCMTLAILPEVGSGG
jgi:hypothetical protein